MMFSFDLLFNSDSQAIDQLLGFEVERIELELLKLAQGQRPQGDTQSWGPGIHQGNQTWVGLDPQTLQTPYHELKEMTDLLAPRPSSHFIDLGAGYGRLALVLHQYDESIRFTGYEFVPERVNHGSEKLLEFGLKNARLLRQDLTAPDFALPDADFYFIYDYGKVAHIRQTLEQLKIIADRTTFKVVARGKGVRSLIENEHPWLSQVHQPEHRENFSIYHMVAPDSPVPVAVGDLVPSQSFSP